MDSINKALIKPLRKSGFLSMCFVFNRSNVNTRQKEGNALPTNGFL